MKDFLNNLKFYLFVFLTVGGLIFNLMLVWIAFGLPQTDWSFFVICVVAGLLDWLYIRWLSN